MGRGALSAWQLLTVQAKIPTAKVFCRPTIRKGQQRRTIKTVVPEPLLVTRVTRITMILLAPNCGYSLNSSMNLEDLIPARCGTWIPGRCLSGIWHNELDLGLLENIP